MFDPKVHRGVILYEGPSVLDPSRMIVAIANRITTASTNEKTGAMIQTFILDATLKPTEAVKSGRDSSVCGSCRHRPSTGGACYVNVGQAPNQVFGAYHRQRYTKDFDPFIFWNKVVRLGTYGDPAAVPGYVWAYAFKHAAAINGYTHQWRTTPLQEMCMASVDTPEERDEARALGWRTFRVRDQNEPVLDREIVCPASKEAGFKTNCAACRACGGTDAKAKADIVIIAHGAKASRFSND